MSVLKHVAYFMILIGCSAGVFAGSISPIPEEDGFSGQVGVGAAWMRVKSNAVAGTRFGDLSSDRIGNRLDGPDSETMISPIFNGELRYTFADTRSQVFLGGDRGDPLRFDRSLAVGVRKQWDDTGIFEGAFLFSISGTEVWKDPYVTGAEREETDRKSTGGRLTWSGMMDSNFHLTYSYRDIDIDNELSGASIGPLTSAQRDMLSREGVHHKAELLYVHQLSENQWLSPTFRYDHYDLDGDAMSHDIVSVMLTHTFATHTYRLITNLTYGFANYDGRNPIYLKTQNADRYGISATLIYPNLFNNKNLTGMLGVAYGLEDANINFYDTEIIAITANTIYRF